MHPVPTLLVDRNKCLKNIRKIALKTNRQNIVFRPHFKTHQSITVGEWYRSEGITSITCSSISMATFFANHGWEDITVAFPLNILEKEAIVDLAGRITLNLCIESEIHLEALRSFEVRNINVLLLIDCGYQRTGIAADDFKTMNRFIKEIDDIPHLTFSGMLTHAGHSYKARSKKAVGAIYQKSINHLQKLKNYFKDAGRPVFISYGDTPTASVIDDFDEMDEIRCGNMVYYDITQHLIGSCTLDEIAVAIECPVVAKHPDRNEIIIYGGGVHFSKDRVEHPEHGIIYGLLVKGQDNGWGSIMEDCYLKSISQEHGILHVPDHVLNQIEIGTTLKILPVHSCMAADLLKEDTFYLEA